MNFHSVSLGSGLVSRSAVFSVVGMYWNLTLPNFTCSLMKWCHMSMCFVHWWFFSVVLFAIYPLLSAQMVRGLLTGNPTS